MILNNRPVYSYTGWKCISSNFHPWILFGAKLSKLFFFFHVTVLPYFGDHYPNFLILLEIFLLWASIHTPSKLPYPPPAHKILAAPLRMNFSLCTSLPCSTPNQTHSTDNLRRTKRSKTATRQPRSSLCSSSAQTRSTLAFLAAISYCWLKLSIYVTTRLFTHISEPLFLPANSSSNVFKLKCSDLIFILNFILLHFIHCTNLVIFLFIYLVIKCIYKPS